MFLRRLVQQAEQPTILAEGDPPLYPLYLYFILVTLQPLLENLNLWDATIWVCDSLELSKTRGDWCHHVPSRNGRLSCTTLILAEGYPRCKH